VPFPPICPLYRPPILLSVIPLRKMFSDRRPVWPP